MPALTSHGLPWSLRVFAFLVAAAVLVACGGGDSSTNPDPDPTPNPVPSSLTISAGDQQQAAGGEAVAVAPAVVVRDGNGQTMSGVQVQFSVVEGGGSITGGSPSTNAQGIAAVGSWTLGPNGTQRLRAQVGSLAPVTFEATITPGSEQLIATIGSGGGTFEINDPEHAFDGLALTVPSGALSGSGEWRLRTSQQAPALQLPAGYRVASPVLEITTSQPRTEDLLTLDIPVSPEPGETVVIVLRDPARGVLEVMPMVAQEEGSVRVMTQHLRGDLLLGPTPPGGAPSAFGFGTQQVGVGEVLAQLFAIGTQEPMPPASVEMERWPVRDHGSHHHPDGHGAAIPLIEASASAIKAWIPPLPSMALSLASEEGMYAEAGPLALVVAAHEVAHATMTRSTGQLYPELDDQGKWERDRMVTNQMIAKMALEGRAVAAVHRLTGPGAPFAFSTVRAGATSGAGAGLTLITATQEAPKEIELVQGSGFLTVPMARIVNALPGETDDAFPLSSFLAPFEKVTASLQILGQLVSAPLGSSQRAQLNAQLAQEAGIPTVQVEVEAVEGGGWLTLAPGERIVLRNLISRFRLMGGAAPSFSLNLLAGAEIGRTESGPMSLQDVVALAAQAEGSPVPHVISAFSQGAGDVGRQISAAVVEIVKATFRIEPEDAEIDGDNLGVQFEVNVPEPPSEGFRVHWDWGDGNESNNLGLTNASHEYDEAGNYQVVATLKSVDGNTILAVDTAVVRGGPGEEILVGPVIMYPSAFAPAHEVTLQVGEVYGQDLGDSVVRLTYRNTRPVEPLAPSCSNPALAFPYVIGVGLVRVEPPRSADDADELWDGFVAFIDSDWSQGVYPDNPASNHGIFRGYDGPGRSFVIDGTRSTDDQFQPGDWVSVDMQMTEGKTLADFLAETYHVPVNGPLNSPDYLDETMFSLNGFTDEGRSDMNRAGWFNECDAFGFRKFTWIRGGLLRVIED